MKYSYNWLQSHIEDPLPSVEELKEAIIFHAFEVENVEVLENDAVLDIKVLPDRSGDCLSHYGMAREIAGLLDLNRISPHYQLPAMQSAVPIAIDVQTSECIRYCAIQVDGITVGPSPAWLVEKLAAVGQRSINNVVDVTNYILLDTGQPTHAFDADKLNGTLTIRHAATDETITTLSNEQKNLQPSMMVIADAEHALAIAGIKGGTVAEVTDQTTSIILEIANFDAVAIRKTSRMLGLITDASKRFENNLGSYLVESAAAQLVALIQTVAGGTVTAMGEHYPYPQIERALAFTLAGMQRILGSTVTDKTIIRMLDQYEYTYEKNNDFYTVAIPLWRADIVGLHDMAEEVGRVVGYDTIPVAALPFTPSITPNEAHEHVRSIKHYLFRQGYSEVMTYSFRKKGELFVAHGPKDKSALRTHLTDAVKESYEINRLNAALLGLEEVKLFEVGAVFTPEGEEVHVATADKKGVQEYSLNDFLSQYAIADISTTFSGPAQRVSSFKQWSNFPFITRDIAVWISNESQKILLQKIIETFAQMHCARPAVLFDTFMKEGKTSMAYRLVFQSTEKTLTDDEVEKIFQTLIMEIASHAMDIR
jgi:phenylalanyl-tRNA synthetase beta chain